MRPAILVLAAVLGGLVGFLGPSQVAYAAGYTFTTLDVPGGNNTAPYGVNDAGQIVGSFASSTGVHGFLYSGGRFTQIDVPGSTYTEAFGINYAGQIVGWYQVDGSGQFAFVDTGGSFSQIQYGPTYTIAHGINDPGAIVGYWNDSLGQHGFLLVSGTFTPFDATTPGGGAYTRAYGINNAGQITGTFFGSGGVHGFLYSGGGFTQIDAPGAVGSTQVFGVNDVGQMVGIEDGGLGFVDTAGSFSPLNVPGARNTTPLGINHQGTVVGYFTSSADGLQHGFIATPLTFAGTPGRPNCHGQSVAALARQYGGLKAAAAALGFSSVSALQNAIRAFCAG
jgi:probable HAF family extracellular repeat protein